MTQYKCSCGLFFLMMDIRKSCLSYISDYFFIQIAVNKEQRKKCQLYGWITLIWLAIFDVSLMLGWTNWLTS